MAATVQAALRAGERAVGSLTQPGQAVRNDLGARAGPAEALRGQGAGWRDGLCGNSSQGAQGKPPAQQAGRRQAGDAAHGAQVTLRTRAQRSIE